jgi:RNA polymerase sigma-70 factor (ECF subfamily)
VIKTRPLTIGEGGNVGFDVRRLDVSEKQNDAAHRIRSAVDEHFELVWRSLRRFGVPKASADDAAQQVLMIFSRRIDDISPGAERAFLLSTAIRVAADHRRSQKRSREVLTEDRFDDHASSNLPPDALIDRERARQLLDVVLNELPDELRVVFVLYELEEMTMRSIAEMLALPGGTVASRLRRAREMFESIAERLRGPQ